MAWGMPLLNRLTEEGKQGSGKGWAAPSVSVSREGNEICEVVILGPRWTWHQPNDQSGLPKVCHQFEKWRLQFFPPQQYLTICKGSLTQQFSLFANYPSVLASLSSRDMPTSQSYVRISPRLQIHNICTSKDRTIIQALSYLKWFALPRYLGPTTICTLLSSERYI